MAKKEKPKFEHRHYELLEVGGTLTKFGDVLRSRSGQHISNSVPSGGQI